MKNTIFLWIISITLSLTGTCQQQYGGGEDNPDLKTNKEALDQWQDLKFGMFIHWGPVSLRGTEIGWSRGSIIPIVEYDQLFNEFNPSLFNAEEWVKTAKEAGMKYLVITTKHHDGFCLWESKYTKFDMASTPYGKDVLRALSDECKKQGIWFGTYYSILDWHHPDYTTRYGGDPRPVENSDMNKYIEYMYGQVKELIKDYKTRILWFDGEWENSWNHKEGMKLYQFCREQNDDLLINNRVDKGRKGMQGMFAANFAGDFGTPEQRVGTFEPDIPWESCITIGTQWAWKPNDFIKSSQECIHTLISTAGGNGNLLLNVGPMMDGRIEQRQVNILKEIGGWLNEYGESVYGTRGGPYKPEHWIASTYKENRIYIHLMKWPSGELILPKPSNNKILAVSVFNGKPLEYRIKGENVIIQLPENPPNIVSSILVLELRKSASGIAPINVPDNKTIGPDPSLLTLRYPASAQYGQGNQKILINNKKGSLIHNDGQWLGFEANDFEIVIDLKTRHSIKGINVGFLQKQDSRIFLPESVSFLQSEDGKIFKLIKTIGSDNTIQDGLVKRDDFYISPKDLTTRYLKISAENPGLCPSWHRGAGKKAWIFVDEVTID